MRRGGRGEPPLGRQRRRTADTTTMPCLHVHRWWGALGVRLTRVTAVWLCALGCARSGVCPPRVPPPSPLGDRGGGGGGLACGGWA